MKKRHLCGNNFSKKIAELNKRALAQEHIVDLNAYRCASHLNEFKSILLVDDDPVMLNAMKRIFENNDFIVFVAKDAMEVSQIIENTALDIILLDAQLPWVDGYELCSLLKSTPYLRELPIALISGNKTEEDIRKGFECGCDEYITKPFNVGELKKTVYELLQKSS